MEQYKQLLQSIQSKGSYKPAAREGLPGTTSLFGYQFRHDLADGFPALTTKKLYWKGVVIELLWFLKGDTHIKFLDDHGVRKMWHEDAYNYYVKIASANTGDDARGIYYDNGNETLRMFTFEEFCIRIKESSLEQLKRNFSYKDYTLGDCGVQYGKLWRDWEGAGIPQVLSIKTDHLTREQVEEFHQKWKEANAKQYPHIIISQDLEPQFIQKGTDQIKDLIDGLKNSPMSRRHIITAWNPSTLENMALNACHAFVQFNCRIIDDIKRVEIYNNLNKGFSSKRLLGHYIYPEDYTPQNEDDVPDPIGWELTNEEREYLDSYQIPRYCLDCQMYQRSADAFLGVPLNIASYALLTHILCQICNMVPGDFIHTFGDVHIYDNHQDQVKEQLSRQERPLPILKINNGFVVDWDNVWNQDIDKIIQDIIEGGWQNIFTLENYDPHPAIEGKLSTGLK